MGAKTCLKNNVFLVFVQTRFSFKLFNKVVVLRLYREILKDANIFSDHARAQ